MNELKYSKANAKIQALSAVDGVASYLSNKRKVYSFDLISGWSCPYAFNCLSKVVVDKTTGKRAIKDGPNTEYRCFSASQEVVYPATYDRRMLHFNILRKLQSSVEIFEALRKVMPKNLGVCRVHVGGDMFNRKYMLAWGMMAEAHTDRLFYAYTKSLPFWVKHRDYFDNIPNLVLTASRGGKRDDLIDSEGLREARVVMEPSEAYNLGLEIDHDDSHAADPTMKNQNFALLIHGVQPKGSDASKAVVKLKGVGSYGKGTHGKK